MRRVNIFFFWEIGRRIIWTNTGRIRNAEKEDRLYGKGVYSLIENEKSMFDGMIRNREDVCSGGFFPEERAGIEEEIFSTD